MKIAIINGSARQGNTLTAIRAFLEGVGNNHEVEVLRADELNLLPCRGCGACGCKNGCVLKDDTNAVVDKLIAADLLLFASPVYWWGITAQTKLLIDKCYAKGALLGGKKVGVITIGGDSVDGPQYRLIREQFECISKYLKWDFVFYKCYSANQCSDLAAQPDAINELKTLGTSF